jgi:XTP/dITP diphosphohydrolase
LREEEGTLRKGKVAFFVTGNIHKFQEARTELRKHSISLAMLNIDAVEIQSDDLKEIAKTSASDAAENTNMPVFVEDAGLFINVLKGFPGPYSSFVHRTLGTKGILKLMAGTDQRTAYFCSVVAFCNPDENAEPVCFEGKVNGRITRREKGTSGFGFDPIFEPDAELGMVFAQMTTEEKNKHSHRAQSLKEFAEWYSQYKMKQKRKMESAADL